MTKHIIWGSILLLASLFGCTEKGKQFTVSGHIKGGADTTLVLEYIGFGQRPQAIDSVKLDSDGSFTLNGDAPSNPEFYRLRIGNQTINLSVDSTESIGIEAELASMATNYKVTGSGNTDTIRILTQMLWQLNQRCERIADNRSLTLQQRQEAIEAEVQEYKTRVKLDFIQNRYDRASSYFALFQMSGGALVFDPLTDASDVTWISAVANAWQEYWPNSKRTQNLVGIAMRGRRNTRKKVLELELDDKKVKETGIIDMGFTDINGEERRLSSLKGKVVLLDFTAYGLQNSQERNIALRELYNKYHERGLEIYQVAVDADEHYWKTMCRQLPWICVWNPNGQANDIVTIYDVQQVPTWFLVDRTSTLVGRQETLGELEAEIVKLL